MMPVTTAVSAIGDAAGQGGKNQHTESYFQSAHGTCLPINSSRSTHGGAIRLPAHYAIARGTPCRGHSCLCWVSTVCSAQSLREILTPIGITAEVARLLCTFACRRNLRTMTHSVLLDLDGTLIDSYPGISASCLAALRTLGHEPDETVDLRRFIGPPLEDMMHVLLLSFGDDRVDEAAAAYRQHYGETGYLRSVPYPGIGESLEEMKCRGLRLYLATSKRAVFAGRILGHLKFATYFDGIHGSVPGGALDHKPELLAHVLSKHGLSPSRSVMVGDRRHDISGAHAVGMRGLGALWGYGTRDELETAGADRLVDSPGDLAPTVLSMLNGKRA